MTDDASKPSESLEDRVPCSDDMCVGIIGADGRCGTCGKPGTPPVRKEGQPADHPEHPHDDLHQTSSAPAAPREDSDQDDDQDDDDGDASGGDEERVPCLDDMCVGILSAERKCGTCGKTWPAPRPG